MKLNLEHLNQESQIFKSKLQEMKKKCYDEMNRNYQNILQEKIQEIQKSIIKDVEQQNKNIFDNYVIQFEELEQKRENDYNEMSRIVINNEQKEEQMSELMVKTPHYGIKCEECGKNPIYGNRYKCSVCKNYNLCEDCEEINSQKKKHKHNFIKIRKAERKE